MAEVTITTPVAQEDPAHVAAMLTRANGATPEGERPAWLPEGFNTVEELAAAYTSGSVTPPAKTEAPAAPAEEPLSTATDPDAEAIVTAAGLDMNTLGQKVVSGEGLSAADYAALAAQGIPKGTVDAFVAGQIAIGEQLVGRMHQHVGGAETFNAMMAWAGEGNLSAAEVNAFNNIIDNGDEAAVKMALSGLQARYAAGGNNAPKLLGGGRTASAGDVYESIAQMMTDMRDPRYATDPAFRSKVESKVGRSSIL
jgi:hypothetical protein